MPASRSRNKPAIKCCLNVNRFILFVMVGVCCGLHYYTYEAKNEISLNIITGTYAAFAIVLFGHLSAACCSQDISKSLELCYLLVGTVMFVAAGVLNLNHFGHVWYKFWQDKKLHELGVIKAYVSFSVALDFAICFICSCACRNEPVYRAPVDTYPI